MYLLRWPQGRCSCCWFGGSCRTPHKTSATLAPCEIVCWRRQVSVFAENGTMRPWARCSSEIRRRGRRGNGVGFIPVAPLVQVGAWVLAVFDIVAIHKASLPVCREPRDGLECLGSVLLGHRAPDALDVLGCEMPRILLIPLGTGFIFEWVGQSNSPTKGRRGRRPMFPASTGFLTTWSRCATLEWGRVILVY